MEKYRQKRSNTAQDRPRLTFHFRCFFSRIFLKSSNPRERPSHS